MQQNSIKSKLFLLKISIITLAIFIPATFYLNKVASSSRKVINQALAIERDFAGLFLKERDSLKNIESLDEILDIQESLLQEVAFLDSAELSSLLFERKKIFKDSFQSVKQSSTLLLNVHETIVFLIDSTKYIHEHHIAYFKNFMRRGSFSQDYDVNENFQRSPEASAPEIEIIRVASIIQSILVDILDSFNDVFLNIHMVSRKKQFPEIIANFYTAVNAFEDYSLDAQDGILVEELLTKGRVLEKQFNTLRELEDNKQTHMDSLAGNRISLHSTLLQRKEELAYAYNRTLTIINTLQAIIILFVLILASFIFLYGKRIIADITKTVHETEKINMDLSYQIVPGANTFDEFNMVFQTLNNMASQINTSMLELKQAHSEMESRVAERTFEQQETNRLLLQEIEERKQAEEEKENLQTQLQQTQKMEAIGTLAGGIAHDFNNILTALIGYTELAKLKTKEGAPVDYELDVISESSNRAKELVKQILAFSRQSMQDVSILKIQPIIQESTKLLRSSIPTTISIVENIDPQVGAIKADPTQIHQITMNLCNNAFHAMEETGGTLEISYSSFLLTPGDKNILPNLTPGEYCKLTISDTGHGLDPSIKERIFEPFFTTKAVGKGTGMGLSVVHGIVESYGGSITVTSSLGEGTTFDVYLPLAAHEAKMQHIKEETGVIDGHEKILLIDDEPTIVDMLKKSLEFFGYEVDAMTKSTVALELFQTNPLKYNAVITDQTMPEMTGIEFAGEIRKTNAHIPIILCSGYSIPVSEKKMTELKITEFVTKPTTGIKLSGIMRKIFDNPQ